MSDNIGIDAPKSEVLNPETGVPFRFKYWKVLEKRKQLAIWQHREQFMQLLGREDIQFILLEAETGSGKSTQIPQWCVEWLRENRPHNRQMVVCTQPRQLAALRVAKRVALEMDVKLGEAVGYSIRFEDAVSFQTVLKYCTDGVLLAEATRNRKLDKYSIIVLDEVHERSMITDVLMGLIKQIAAKRPDLRVVVMSATMKTGNFRNYFDQRCVELKLPGRTWPVEIVHNSSSRHDYSAISKRIKVDRHAEPELEPYCWMAMEKVKEVHVEEPPGDILLFLTGEEDVQNVCDRLNEHKFDSDVGHLECLPLYSSLPYEQQQLVFQKQPSQAPGQPINRRCIVATNIAETSMTIDSVVFVVDPGLSKQMHFDRKTRIESLTVQSITQASAIQRAGRAGRTRPGKCFRLYFKVDFKKMKPVDPEIRHANMANVVLRMRKYGIRNVHKFDFMEAPPPELLDKAITLLNNLEAFDEHGNLTSLGIKMADLPVDPPLARMLLESIKLKCSREVIIIAAMLSSQNCFCRPKKKRLQADAKKAQFISDRGDHLTLLRVFNAFTKCSKDGGVRRDWCCANFLNYRALQNAADSCEQLENVMKRKLKIEIVSANPSLITSMFNILKALVAGSFMKVAYLDPASVGLNWHAINGEYILPDNLIGEQQSLVAADGQFMVPSMPAGHQIHPGSVISHNKLYANRPPQWILYEKAIYLDNGKHNLCNVSAIRPEWLMQLAPKYFRRLWTINAELEQRLLSASAAGEVEKKDQDDGIGIDNNNTAKWQNLQRLLAGMMNSLHEEEFDDDESD